MPSGWSFLLVADRLWCVAHDDRTGRVRVSPRVEGLGLAAGVLGELALSGWLDVYDGELFVLRAEAPVDPVHRWALATIVAEGRYRGVRTWLAFLAEAVPGLVVDRLASHGLLVWERQRSLFGSRLVYRPVDPDAVFWPEVDLLHKLTTPRVMADEDALLAGLVAACGLAGHVLYVADTREVGLRRLAVEVARLRPGLRELVAHTEAAVGDAVLAPH